MMMLISRPTTIKSNNVVANNIKSTSLVLKPSANLSLLFNPFNYFSTEQENESKNAANSDYYDIDQFQTLKLHEKNILLLLNIPLEKLPKEKKQVFLLGDFNTNLLNIMIINLQMNF